eukprot:5774968-Pyramimonas_sp.AAC.1
MQKDTLALRLLPKGKLFLDQGHSIRDTFTQYRVAAFFASLDPAGLRKVYWDQASARPLVPPQDLSTPEAPPVPEPHQ